MSSAETSGSISIDAALGRNIDTATILTAVIDKIADAAGDSSKDITGLEIALDSGTVALDDKALAAASQQAADSTLIIQVEQIAKSDLSASHLRFLSGG